MNPLLDKILRETLVAALPRTNLSCSEWAEQYRHVSPERSRFAGRWLNERVPYLKEIMDAASDPKIRRVVFKKSSQVAGSEFAVNYIGYRVHLSPTMIIYCAENEDKSNAFVYESFDTALEVTPALKERIPAKSGTEDNNLKRKKFPGGLLSIVYATSAAQLSSRPAEVVIIDEVDACVENSEGSPVSLLEARTKTFDDIKKIILISSPRDKETSVIEAEYEASDQRKFYVPCPHCGEYQILSWANVRWDEEPLDAYYVCEPSGCVIEHEEKESMLARGKWMASQPLRESAGFAINELYSPFTTWGSMAERFLKAKKFRSTLKTFINTALGEPWEEQGEQIEFADLTFRREDYEAEVPPGVAVLTAGVDVQDDRLEIEVVGWGRDLESWSIDYKVIEGSPGLFDVWDSLSDYLTQDFEGLNRNFKIKAACIDSGGHHTSQVYKFCKANSGRRWLAVKGANVSGKPVASRPSIVGKNKVRLFTVGTDTAKDEIFSFLRVDEPGPGFCHFPAAYEDGFFKQLCAEKKVTKYRMGVAYQMYQKVSQSARNEALDCRVYATAARVILNPNLGKMADRADRKNETIAADDEMNLPDREIDRLNNEINRPETVEKPKKRKRIKINNPFANRSMGAWK
jgi:phage terminase large subunit GpA-like protein